MIVTAVLWMLVSVGNEYHRTSLPTQVVQRFKTLDQCEFVQKQIIKASGRNPSSTPKLLCIRAEVAEIVKD